MHCWILPFDIGIQHNTGYVLHHFNISFFANDLLVVVYFILILDCRIDVRQKVNLSNFLIWVQNGFKVRETTRNIHNAFGSETADECTVQ